MIQFACETYTWQMPGEQYKGRLEHIMNVCQQAGFSGIEPETSFLQHLENPVLMQEALEQFDQELAVLCVVEDWKQSSETKEEKERVNKWIEFLQNFPDTILLLVQMPGANRNNLKERQNNLVSCINEIARRAKDRGISCSYHPNSPNGSIIRIESDYQYLLENIDHDVLGYCPDVGHIAKGGMDPLSIIKKYRDAVNLIHYKDMYEDGRWAPTGDGIIDFTTITTYLIETNYNGWIVMEDECDRALTDPDGLTLEDGKWTDQHLRPLLK